MSFSPEMKGDKLLLALLFVTAQSIKSFDKFSIKKRFSPLFQPNAFWDYQDFDLGLQNEAEKPWSMKSFDPFSMKKRHSPFFLPKPFWGYTDASISLPQA